MPKVKIFQSRWDVFYDKPRRATHSNTLVSDENWFHVCSLSVMSLLTGMHSPYTAYRNPTIFVQLYEIYIILDVPTSLLSCTSRSELYPFSPSLRISEPFLSAFVQVTILFIHRLHPPLCGGKRSGLSLGRRMTMPGLVC